MAEPRRNPAVWGIAGLAVAAIAGGLAVTGGPGQGRAERRDDLRLADLMAIAGHLDCRADAGGGVVTDLSPSPACPAIVRASDPFTGTAYRVEVVDAQNLRLCAGFDLPQPSGALQPRDRGVGADGCIVHRLARSTPTASPPAIPQAPALPSDG